MKNKSYRLTNLVFLGTALVLIMLSAFSYQRMNEQAKAADRVSQTQLLKFKLNDALSHLVKTEAAQRGFILTHDKNFLQDYYSSQSQIPGLLAEIKTLITSNPKQLNNYNSASNLFTERLYFLSQTLVSHENFSFAALDSALLKGKSITDAISNQIDNMITLEDDYLQQRIMTKQAEENRTSAIILLFSGLSIAILVVSFSRLKRVMFNNDILEQKVRERTEEIRSANDVLNRQNLELARKNDELRSFTFIANHDLKEPLRKIGLFVDRVISSPEPLSPSNLELLSKTLDNVERMKALLEDIFIYTLTDKMLEFEPTDLNKTAAAAIENLQESIIEKKAVIDYQNLPTIQGSPVQMEQVFTNLISNSLKYTSVETKPHIKMSAERIRSSNQLIWKIDFIDNGIGFDEKYKEKIFELFQRLHLKNEYSGTGIGLAICKKIIENHGGSISASSKKEGGAVFTILIPENTQ